MKAGEGSAWLVEMGCVNVIGQSFQTGSLL